MRNLIVSTNLNPSNITISRMPEQCKHKLNDLISRFVRLKSCNWTITRHYEMQLHSSVGWRYRASVSLTRSVFNASWNEWETANRKVSLYCRSFFFINRRNVLFLFIYLFIDWFERVTIIKFHHELVESVSTTLFEKSNLLFMRFLWGRKYTGLSFS